MVEAKVMLGGFGGKCYEKAWGTASGMGMSGAVEWRGVQNVVHFGGWLDASIYQ